MVSKTCSTCKESKPIECFGKDSTRNDGLRYHCKTCTSQTTMAWVQRNRDRVNEYNRQHRKRNPELYKAKYARTRAKDSYKEYCKLYQARYRKDNLKRKLFLNSLRRERTAVATPDWLDEAQKLQMIHIYESCPKGWHVDHIYPLKGENSCGLNVPWNLQLLSAADNLAKGNKDPVQWLSEQLEIID